MQWINNTDVLVEDSDKDDVDKRVIFRKVGWLGQTGRFYTNEENPAPSEPGSFSPVYVQIAPE